MQECLMPNCPDFAVLSLPYVYLVVSRMLTKKLGVLPETALYCAGTTLNIPPLVTRDPS